MNYGANDDSDKLKVIKRQKVYEHIVTLKVL